MQLDRVAPDTAWNVTVRWSKPAPYSQVISDGSRHDRDGWLYMILGYYGSSHPKLFYVGKVTQSYVSDRLKQPDHRQRYRKLQKKHPRHSFRVSLGAINMKGRVTERRIDQVETMLIYTACESQRHMINERKWLTHRISAPYVVRNEGYCRPLPREVHVGIFTR